jgi:DNA-binding NarL/FixJ family response regulator
MRVLIVDDSAVVRERLTTLLSEVETVEVVGHAETVHEATTSLHRLNPDAVILDIRLADGSGIDVLTYIQQHRPTLKVIMLTNYPYPQYRQKCLEAGADFFFDKSTEFDQVAQVFRSWVERSPAG